MNNCKRKLHLQNNNKGVTLLEVIMAVAILTIVVIPVIRAIVMSSKFQYKARVRQKLTVVSESIMEDFKAYSLEEMRDRFENHAVYDWLQGASVEDETSFYVEQIDKDYHYKVNQFKMDNVFYDANITVTPMSYYDNVELTQLYDFNAKTCAICEVRDNQNSALRDIRAHFEGNYMEQFLEYLNEKEQLFEDENELKQEDVDFSKLKLLERVVGINVLQEGESYDVYYEIVYRYKIEDYAYNRDKKGTKDTFSFGPLEAKTGDKNYFEFTAVPHHTTYSRPKSDGLNRLYVYYYPIYEQALGNSIIDYVIINNHSINDLDFYLLKQRDPDLGSAVQTYEGSYSPYMERWGDTSHSLNLYHNLVENVGGGIGNSNYTSTVRQDFSNGNGYGENIAEANKKEKNTLLYNVDIEILRDEEVLSKISSTIKK